MKTESVRIKASHMEKLRMLSDLTGHSINWMVDKGVELFLKNEAPVHEAAYREARRKLESKPKNKRQPVISKATS